jgi:tape measure domain-containing protein
MSNVLEYQLRLADAAFTGPLGRARDQTGRFQRELGGLGAQSGSINSLGGAFTGLAGKIGVVTGVLGAVAGAFVGLKSSISAAADFESTSVAFETLIGDATLAQETLKSLKKLGAETPFEFPELANAGRMLIAFGESASTVTDTLRMVGDVSAGIQAPIGEIAEIYGKARTAGTLFAEDINQLTGRGIPVIQEFAKQLNVSEGEVKKLASEGKITFSMLETAFQNLTSQGGKFADMMAKQSGTMNGLWSTLKDNVGELLTTLGTPVNDWLKPRLQGLVGMAGTLNTVLTNAIAKGQVGEVFSNALTLGAKVGVNAVLDLISSIPGRASKAITTLGEALALALSGSFDAAGRMLDGWKSDLLRFDTSTEMEFFKKLTTEAEGAKDQVKQVGKEVQEAAKATETAETAETAAGASPVAAATGNVSRSQGDDRYDENGRRRSDGRRKIIGAKGDGRPSFGGLDEFYRMQEKTEVPFNASGGAGYGRGQAVHKYTVSSSGSGGLAGGGLRHLPQPAGAVSSAGADGGMRRGLDAFHAKNKTQGLTQPFAPQVPSPGAALRNQEKRESATTSARASGGSSGGSSGSHPLAAVLKDIQTKLNSLAVAT